MGNIQKWSYRVFLFSSHDTCRYHEKKPVRLLYYIYPAVLLVDLASLPAKKKTDIFPKNNTRSAFRVVADTGDHSHAAAT